MIARDFKNFISRDQWMIEMGLGFFLLIGLNGLVFSGNIGFLNVAPHPYWIVILLMAVKYGLVPGIVSGFLAMTFHVLFRFGHWPSRLEIEQMAEYGQLTLPLCFLAAGTLLGAIRQGDIERSNENETRLSEMRLKAAQLKELYDAGEQARRVLETRIIGETSTFKTLYAQLSRLETLNEGEIYSICLEILAEYFHVEQAALYMKEGDFFVLKAAHGLNRGEMVSGKVAAKRNWMNIALAEKKVITVRDLVSYPSSDRYEDPSGKVLAMIPFVPDFEGDRRFNRQTIDPVSLTPFEGVVNIEKVDFLYLNSAQLEAMHWVVRWASKSLAMVKKIRGIEVERLYDRAQGVFSFNYFQDCLESEWVRAQRAKTSLTAAVLKIDRFGFMPPLEQEMIKKTFLFNLKRLLTLTDSLFSHRFEGIYLLLAPLRKQSELETMIREVSNETAAVGGQVTGEFLECSRDMKTADAWINPVLERAGLPLLDR